VSHSIFISSPETALEDAALMYQLERSVLNCVGADAYGECGFDSGEVAQSDSHHFQGRQQARKFPNEGTSRE